jgi:hypothetical protein
LKGGEKMLTVTKTAEKFNVTEQSVRNWIKDGMKINWKKEIGKKPHIVIDPKDVEKYHKSKCK